MEDLPLHITVTLVPELAVDDLPLGSTATLVPEFAVEDLALGRTVTLVPEFAVEYLPSTELETCFLRLPSRTCPCSEHSDYKNAAPVAVYDGCGIVAFVYWLRLKQYL